MSCDHTTQRHFDKMWASQNISMYMHKLLVSRLKMQQILPTETHRIAGVTFEDRQYLLSRLTPDMPLTFEKEPHNPHDSNAVAIKMMDGRKLGYIPKQETASFKHSICIGKVRSTGQNQATLKLGCLVDVQPKLPPVVNLSIPSNLVGSCRDLTRQLEGQSWDSLKQRLVRRMNSKCSITGITTRNVEARWNLLEQNKIVKLMGFVLQDEAIREIQYVNPIIKKEEGNVCAAIAAFNGIQEEDAMTLFLRQVEISNNRFQEDWRLDLSYLHEIGLKIPTQL